jgi:hypothetical protein
MLFFVAACLTAALESTHAEIVTTEQVAISPTCSTTDGLAVVTGSQLRALAEVPIQHISLLKYSAQRLSAVTFQIDRKDPQGRYLIESAETSKQTAAGVILDENDELVFRAMDLGKKLPESSELVRSHSLVEIQVDVPNSGTHGWMYVSTSNHDTMPQSDTFIRYRPDTDSVTGRQYRIGFSERQPFLIDLFRWKLTGERGWSPDISDTMKIRHRGKFLGFLNFERTHADYSSKLVSVKQGPLRIIRRTSNRVRMLWKLKSPVLYVDYVMMPDGFVMDTVIDIPFNVGLFFSDVVTLTTMDWNDDPSLPDLSIHAPNGDRLPVTGHMSADKRLFNTINSNQFAVSSPWGKLFVRLDIPDDFPIRPWLYLSDEITVADSPENHRGQFGNVGFRTTQWERVDSDIHHLKFTACARGEE